MWGSEPAQACTRVSPFQKRLFMRGQAALRDGILELTIPKRMPTPEPKRCKVKAKEAK